MRVFLLDLMTLSTINKKEEITDQTYLITDAEAEAIEIALSKGCKIKGENGNLIISSQRPSEYHDFDTEKWQWVLNKERFDVYLTEKRKELWEAVKTKREKVLTSGVFVKSLNKWFHTDSVSQLSYTRAKEYFDIKHDGEIQWKTMDNSFVTLDKDKLNDVVITIFENSQKIYKIAEQHRHRIENSVDLDNYDINSDWTETYKGR